jgi:putative ABC transport system permease protein
MRSRARRYLLSGFGIVIGVATMLSIGVTNQAALGSIVELFENTSGKAQLLISAAGEDQSGFSESVRRVVENFPGVALAAPSITAYSVPSDEAAPAELSFGLFGTSTQGLQLNGIDPEIDPYLREYQLTEGRFIQPDSSRYEVVLVEDYAADKSIQVGDYLGILTPNGVTQIQVVGLIARQGPGRTNNGSFGVLALNVAQELFNREGELDQLDLITIDENPTEEELEETIQQLQQRLGDTYSVTLPAARGKRMTQMLQSYQIGLNFMSGIALFVGAFLIYNAFAMTVIERTREFGMLRTVGMTRRQVTGLVLLEAGFLGVLGSFGGLFIGVFLARGMTSLMEVILNQELAGVEVGMSSLIFSWTIGLAVTLFASGIPAWQAGKISPMEALQIRGKSEEGWVVVHGWKLGVVLFALSAVLLILNPFPYDVQFRLGSMTVFGLFGGAALLIPSTVGFWERLNRPALALVFGSSGDLGSRNVQRARQRTTLTVAALMVGVAMVIITRGMTESFARDLKEWIGAYIGGDIYASSSIPLRSDIGDRIESVAGVEAVTPIRYLNIEWQQSEGTPEDLIFMAIEPASYAQVTRIIFSGDEVSPEEALNALNQGGGVLISSVVAEKFDLSPGDGIMLRTRAGIKEFQVIAVVVDFYNQGMVVQGSWNDMRRFYRVNDASTFLIKVAPTHSVSGVMNEIDDLYGQRYRLILEANDAIQARIQLLMDRAFSMFDVMALISIVVGSLGIVNTLTMSVIERTQEIGMLRAIGMTRAQIVRMVLAEAALMGVLGGVLGLFTGAILARIIFIGMTTMSGYSLTFVLPPEGLVVSFIGAVIISLIAAIFPARRAARIAILEAVRYE